MFNIVYCKHMYMIILAKTRFEIDAKGNLGFISKLLFVYKVFSF